MKKSYINKYIVGAGMIILSSCKVGGDVNVSPNQSPNAVSGFMLTSAIQAVGGINGSGAGTNINSFTGELYSQYIAETQYTNESLFSLKQYDYQSYYTGPLTDLKTVIAVNTDPVKKNQSIVTRFGSNNNQIAAARILTAFVYLTITDRWGDIPYSQALSGAANFSPAFDAQKDVYAGLIKELDQAQQQFDSKGDLDAGADILFNGDSGKWKRWANSLHAIMALRLSKVDPTTGRAEFAKAVAAGLMTSNDDNATYKYLAAQTNENPYFNNYRNRYDYAVSSLMVNTLQGLKDPRLTAYVAPTVDGTYVGLPYGTYGGALKSYKIGTRDKPGTVSQIGEAYSSQNSPSVWTSYAQILFAQAEAAHLGWISGGDNAAADFYNKGITASLAQNSINGTDAAAYIAQDAVKFSASTAMDQIMLQKWIAGFLSDGWETWAEYRRTGLPKLLDPVPGSLSPNQFIPRRQQYPQTEIDQNKANYQTVIGRQGPDALDTRMYWDKK
ncbi:SusD/RagB family nutrient-binding outer membrane lipoprotein [Mucilaginibacter aquaedulcis]|uniref:SusD/RagB family nutrient-binding outer membrane lipoprotein n=1 Tax=Mucilaginibacter aquaedulcis TaxID=1187081 RepID=UPI0025B30353|nr:SusD/RagB family nutrient-binding outer membrane lipoprotein [Mucilaginibacter aquaedulcis]MDN3549776.1 SusD/RagB family nutrient-binding outer membrane lipoprotein [Mucilaginibacter aquaedulcis]